MQEPQKVYRFFISSCKRLLESERRMLSDIILSQGHLPIQMDNHFLGSNSELSINIDKEKIEQSDCIIFILSFLYGEKIDKKIGDCSCCPLYNCNSTIENCERCHNASNNKCQLSFTEFEYEYAKKLKKPIIVIFNREYNNDSTFEKINNKCLKTNKENHRGAFYGDREKNRRFVNKLTIGNSYPYTTENEFYRACSNAVKAAENLIEENEAIGNGLGGLVPYKEYYNLKQSEEKICSQIKELQHKSVETVFNSQSEVFSSLAIEQNIYLGNNDEILPIRVLAIRGISFIEMGREWREFILDDKYKNGIDVPVEFVLGNVENDELIRGRYNAFKSFAKDFNAFKSNYIDEMNRVQAVISKYKYSCKLYLHDEARLPFRMVFIDKYLYLSSFLENKQVKNSPVIKIPSSSSLYQVCEEYYDWVKKSSKLIIER